MCETAYIACRLTTAAGIGRCSCCFQKGVTKIRLQVTLQEQVEQKTSGGFRCRTSVLFGDGPRIEFVVFPGDLVLGSGTGAPPLKQQLETWRYGFIDNDTTYELMKKVYNVGITVMPVRGNHEIAGSDPGDVWKAVFPEIPDNGPDNYKGFTFYIKHRNALFIGMDVYDGEDDNIPHELNQTNLDWLYGVLGDNTWAVAGDDVRQHVFSFTHEPAFSVRHTDCLDDNTLTRDDFWKTLEEELGSRLYFTGHDHFYDHAEVVKSVGPHPDKYRVHQMLVGTAGAPLRNISAHDGDNSSWRPNRIKFVGGEGSNLYGYVVAEVYGAKVRTHWKQRTDTVVNLPYPGAYEPGSDVFDYSVPEDIWAPEIKSVTAENKNTVVVVFNEWVEETSAENRNNYTITGGSNPDVTVAVLDADNAKKVILTTDTLSTGTQYTLAVDGVKDRSPMANETDPQETQGTFTVTQSNYDEYGVKVADGDDDAEERGSNAGSNPGDMYLTSSDLELVNDGSSRGDQVIGIRFRNVYIPQGTQITEAYIQFSAESTTSAAITLKIEGQKSGNAEMFTYEQYNISLRPRTIENESWQKAQDVDTWDDDARGSAQLTPNIADIIKEIVGQTGEDSWSNGNSLVIIITANGQAGPRRAHSYEGSWTDFDSNSEVPELRVKW